eukprot:2597290-Pyramimonas_sp.AAC.1
MSDDLTRELYTAAHEGNVRALASLLDTGALVNASDSKGLTALHVACAAGQLPVVEVLLARGSNPNRYERPQIGST